MLPPKNQPSPVAYDPIVFRLGGAQTKICHELGEEYLKRTLEIVVENKVFFFLPGLLALLPTLRRTDWMTDASAVSFIHSSNEAIGWSFGLLDLQSVGHQGCQTFSFSQEPGAFSVGGFHISGKPSGNPKNTKLMGKRGWCLGSFSRGPGNFGAFVDTPWKFNIAPENGWLEDEFPFGSPYFQGLCLTLGW